MSLPSGFGSPHGACSRKPLVQLPSPAPGVLGEASESDGGGAGAAGLTGNTESVSESGLGLDGEQALEDSVAFRFLAGTQKQQQLSALLIH